jgi:acyl carrier protein phosphodiesterase
MNYLVHLYLSDPAPLCRLGNLMGDFVKGPLGGLTLPDELLRGLRQHRAVDRLALDHPAVRASKARLDDCFGHLKPILVDIFYDHLLAKNWSTWGLGTLAAYAAQAYHLFKTHERLLPDTFRPIVKRMIEHDWLSAYQHPATIKMVLERMTTRLSRPNLLAQGYGQLVRCGRAMETDCRAFLQAAQLTLVRESPHKGGAPT